MLKKKYINILKIESKMNIHEVISKLIKIFSIRICTSLIYNLHLTIIQFSNLKINYAIVLKFSRVFYNAKYYL